MEKKGDTIKMTRKPEGTLDLLGFFKDPEIIGQLIDGKYTHWD